MPIRYRHPLHRYSTPARRFFGGRWRLCSLIAVRTLRRNLLRLERAYVPNGLENHLRAVDAFRSIFLHGFDQRDKNGALESAAWRSKVPDFPKHAEIFFGFWFYTAGDASYWKGCWSDSTDYSKARKKVLERRCWKWYHCSRDCASKAFWKRLAFSSIKYSREIGEHVEGQL